MKKSRLFLMVFAIVFCATVTMCISYGFLHLLFHIKPAVARGGVFSVVFGLVFLCVGMLGYAFITYNVVCELKRELKLRSLKRATSGGKKDYE